MLRRRLAAAALAALTAALLTLPGVAAGAQTGGGDVLVANARFPSASDYQELPAGSADLEVRKAGSGEVLARADNVQLASGSISSLVAVGGIGEKLELLDLSDAAAAVSAAGGVATGAGGTSHGPFAGGRRFALVLLIGGGLAAAAGFVVQQRRSTG
jgi:uncharacterized protein DUF4397